jgi:hypothetical protein
MSHRDRTQTVGRPSATTTTTFNCNLHQVHHGGTTTFMRMTVDDDDEEEEEGL